MKAKYTLLTLLVLLSMLLSACGAAVPKQPAVARIGWTGYNPVPDSHG